MPGGNKKVSHIRKQTCVTLLLPPGIKGLNSLHNKYGPNKDFSPSQVKGFYENWEACFAFCDAILDINNISYEKQYTMDE